MRRISRWCYFALLVGCAASIRSSEAADLALYTDAPLTSQSQSTKLLPSDGVDADFFGFSVSVSGSTVVVGSRQDDDNGTESGAAYVYSQPAGGGGGTVTEIAKLLPSDGQPGDGFGHWVSVSGDTVVVGAGDADPYGSESGAAYVFVRPPGGWTGTINESAKLLASDGGSGDLFGHDVAIDGDVIVVGAERATVAEERAGAAYVFTRPEGGWSGTVNEAAKLIALGGLPTDGYGESVAISGDTVLVGADGGNGAAYVFIRPLGGWAGTLTETAKLLASDGANLDFFGRSVAVDGDTVAVCAIRDDDGGDETGSIYVFIRPETGWAGTLTEAAKLFASDGGPGDQLGHALAVQGDLVVAGAEFDDDTGADSGSAYVFERPLAGWSGTLAERTKLLPSDNAAGDRFGFSAGIDNGTVVVSAHGDDAWRGSAYVFAVTPTGQLFRDDFETGDPSRWSVTAQ